MLNASIVYGGLQLAGVVDSMDFVTLGALEFAAFDTSCPSRLGAEGWGALLMVREDGRGAGVSGATAARGAKATIIVMSRSN